MKGVELTKIAAVLMDCLLLHGTMPVETMGIILTKYTNVP